MNPSEPPPEDLRLRARRPALRRVEPRMSTAMENVVADNPSVTELVDSWMNGNRSWGVGAWATQKRRIDR